MTQFFRTNRKFWLGKTGITLLASLLGSLAVAQSEILIEACNNIDSKTKRAACLSEVLKKSSNAKTLAPIPINSAPLLSKEEECLESTKMSFKDPESVRVLKNLGNRGQTDMNNESFWLRYSATNSYGGRISANIACTKAAGGWVRDEIWEKASISKIQKMADIVRDKSVASIQSSVTECNGTCINTAQEAGRKAGQAIADIEIGKIGRYLQNFGSETVMQGLENIDQVTNELLISIAAPKEEKFIATVAESFGLSLSDVTDAQLKELNIKNGVRVDATAEVAARAGIREGDVIVQIANIEVGSVKEIEATLNKLDKSKPFNILLRRGEWAQLAVIRPRR